MIHSFPGCELTSARIRQIQDEVAQPIPTAPTWWERLVRLFRAFQ